MKLRTTPPALFVLLLLSSSLSPVGAQESSGDAPIAIADVQRTEPVNFTKDLLPIFQKSCLACHSASEAYGELVLETPQAIIKGGDSGPAVVPGKSAESLLLKVASHQTDPLMPPPDNDVAAKPLTPEELGLIKLWIDQGAKGSALAGIISPETWRPLPPGEHPIYAVAITPDGQFVACGRANQIFVYHAPTGQLITRLNDPALQSMSSDKRPGIAHLDVVQSLAVNRAGDLLASGGFRTVKLWRYPRDVARLNLTAADAVTVVAVSPDRSLLAAAAADNLIKLWHIASGEEAGSLAGHDAPVRTLAFSNDGARLYSASADKTLRVWNPSDGKLLGRIDAPVELTSLAAFHLPAPAETAPADQAAADDAQPVSLERLATGGGDNLVRLWNVPGALSETLADMPKDTRVLAVNDDRTIVAAAGAEGAIRVFEAVAGKLVHTWQAHEGPIHALSFAPAIKPEPPAEGAEPAAELPPRLATAGEDGTVRIWNYAKGELLTALRGSLAPVTAAAFLPDGKRLLAGAADGESTLWNLETAAPRALDRAGDAPATLSALSPDGKRLAVSTQVAERPAIIVRDLESGKVTHTLLGHGGAVASLAFSADGTKLASGAADKTARIWDLSDAKFPELAQLAGHEAAVNGVAFNADATQLLTGSADMTAKLWNLADQSQIADFAGHTAPIVAVAMAGNQPVTASADKTVRVWNPADGKAVRTITDPAAIRAMTVSRDNARIALAAADDNVRIYQLADGALAATLTGGQKELASLSFSPDGARLLTADAASCMVWQVADGRLLEIIPVDEGLSAATYGPAADSLLLADKTGAVTVRSMRFALALGDMAQHVTKVLTHPNGQTVYAACADGTVRGFAVANGQQAFAANHGAAVHDLDLSPDGQRLASAGEDKLIKFFNSGNGGGVAPQQLAGFESPVRSITFTPDGARVVGGGAAETGELLVFNAADGALEERLVGHAGAITSLAAYGEPEPRFLSASADGTVRRWRLHSAGRIAGHGQPVTSLAANPAQPGEIVSGSADGTVRRFNAANGQQVQQLNYGVPIEAIAVRADGQRIAAAGANNTARLFNPANGQQIAEMKGDIRADTLVAKLTQEKNDITTKLAAAKTRVEAAETDLPTKTTAEKTAADALAAAEKDVEAKAGALSTASTAKSAAEKVAIEAAAAAQKAAQAMELANQKALEAAAKAKLLAEKAAEAQTLAQGNPEDQALAKAAEMASVAAGAADAEAKAMESAKAAPTQAAETSSKAAEDAAAQAVAMAKPFTDAAAALAQSQAALMAAKQAHVTAARDLKVATELVPEAKAELTAAETALGQIDTALTAATEAAAAALQPIHSIAFSPDGRTLGTGGDFAAVHAWDAETGKPIASYVGHEGAIAAIAFVSDDELASGAADKSVRVWNLNPGWRLERTIGDIADPATLVDRVMALDFSPDGKLLATGGGVPSRSGEVKIFSVADGSPVLSLPEAHTDGVNAVAFSPDGMHLASAGADKYVKKFDVATGRQVAQFEGHTNHVLGVSWRAGGRILASSGADNTIRIWNAETGDRIREIGGFNKQVTGVRFVGQTQFTVSSSGDPFVRMHNTDNGGVQRNYGGPAEYMYAVDITPDQQYLVAGGHDGVLHVWNGAGGQVLHTLAPPAPVEKETASSENEPASPEN